MEEHLGKIVKTRIIETDPSSYYSLVGRIVNGSLKRKACYVAYLGDTRKVKEQEIIVRLDQQKDRIRDYLEPKISLFGNFITSKIPFFFKEAHSRDFVLFGVWKDVMRKQTFEATGIDSDIPTVGNIGFYYNPGKMPKVLFYRLEREGEEDTIVPYKLVGNYEPEVSRHDEVGAMRSVLDALRRYCTQIEKKSPHSPRVVIADENAEETVLEKIKRDFSILHMGSPRDLVNRTFRVSGRIPNF